MRVRVSEIFKPDMVVIGKVYTERWMLVNPER